MLQKKAFHPKPYEYSGWLDRIILGIFCKLLIFPRIATFFLKLVQPFFMKTETYLNRLMRSIYLIMGGGNIRQEDNRGFRFGLEDLKNFYLKGTSKEAAKDRKPVVWNAWCVSHEFLRGFDVHVVVAEALSVIGSFKGRDVVGKLLDIVESQGIPKESCSAAKIAAGCFMLEQVPPPDLIVASSHPCDSGVSAYPAIQYLSGAPMFTLDTPYWDDERAYEYYAKNIWSMIDFLEKHLGQKMDWDRFKEACEEENRTNYYLSEMTQMGRAIPCPISISLLIFGWIFKLLCVGKPGVTESVRIFYENAKKRMENGEGYFREENIRILWWDVPIAFANIFPWLEKEFGAVTVTDFIGYVSPTPIDTSDEETMIRDLARTHLHVAMARSVRGPYEFLTGEMESLIEEFSPDCMVFTGHNGCKHGSAMAKLKKSIVKRHGIPATYLSTDIFDTRNATEEVVKREITDFFRSNGLV